MNPRDRAVAFVKALPPAQRIGIITAGVALVLMLVLFARWVSSPSYTVLYSDLEPASVSQVVDELEAEGIPYRLERGGATIMIPREQLYATRASLAGVGVGGTTTPQGYELLEEQGLSVSDFRQRIDYQRALEGELSKTLAAMNGIDSATVHLVLPEDELFADEQKPVTASVLLVPNAELSPDEIDTVAFLVSSSVEGLAADQVTVADTNGTVLRAPGDGGATVATNRNLRETREFEKALGEDVAGLLERFTGQSPSVVVRATLNFDEQSTQTETFDPLNQAVTSEQTTSELYEGTGVPPGGAVGVDGGPLPAEGGENRYERADALREFGINNEQSQTIAAPGKVERLSVAIVMDDGSLTDVQLPPGAEVEQLVTAALGLQPERGDEVAVSTIPFPVVEAEEEPEPGLPLASMISQIAGVVVLVLISLGLFLMTSRRRSSSKAIELAPQTAFPVPAELDDTEVLEPVAIATPTSAVKQDVTELVQRQPEEIATLLRGWLADRRQ